MTLAFSYIRFSTPQQKLGNSLQRQLEASATYAAAHGLTLDDTMRDEGLSGYHGRHVAKGGALGRFIQRIEAGEIPKGSVMIVEHLDRLSRQEPSVAQEQFLGIINREIDIVTLIDSQRYTKKTVNANAGQLFLSLGMMIGNHAESAKKAERTADNWRRVRLDKTKLLTPSWIRRTETGPVIIEEKANIVRRLFRDLEHIGMSRLAQQLNLEGIPTLRGRLLSLNKSVWDSSAIKAVVRGRSVLGEQAIGKYIDGKRHETGEVVTDAYPSIVSEAQWYATQQAIESRLKGTGTMDGRKLGQVTNLFGALARCGVCQNRMTVATRGRGFHMYLVCSMGKRRECEATKYHRLDAIEESFLNFLAVSVIMSTAPATDDPAKIMVIHLDDAKSELIKMQAEYDVLFDRFANEPADGPEARGLARKSEAIKAKQLSIKKLDSTISATRTKKPAQSQLDHVRQLLGDLYGEDDQARIVTRAKIAQALPSIVKAVTFAADGSYDIKLVRDLTEMPGSVGFLAKTFNMIGTEFAVGA